PVQSGAYARNASTGPPRVMSAPHSSVDSVSVVPAATGRTLAHRGVRQLTRESRRTHCWPCARDEHGLRIQLAPTKGFLGHATGKPRPRLDDTWFTRFRRSARAHPILEFARKLCSVPRARIELATHGSSDHCSTN